MSALDDVLAKVDGATQTGSSGNWSAKCPAHPDRQPSLSVSSREHGDPGVVVHCHAGCSTSEIVAAIGMTEAELFDRASTDTQRQIAATYPYVNEDGDLLYEVVRWDPKDFRQRRPDGRGGWLWSLGDTRRVLYRLPEVRAGIDAGASVFVVEGEKDADRLTEAGYVATCSPQGAGKWSSVPDAAEQLRGADVVIVADRDKPGYRHAREVRASLLDSARSVITVEAVVGKDAADHLAAGRTVEEFVELDLDDNTDSEEATPDAVEPGGFQPLDLGPVLSGAFEQPTPSVLRRNDRQGLFYAGQLNGIHGDSGTGKGWVVLFACVQQMKSGRNVAYVDLEDVPTSIVARLRLLGASDDEIAERFDYFRPLDALGALDVVHLVEHLTRRDTSLVIIDSLGEAFGLGGIDENLDSDVGPWLRSRMRPLADAGPAVVMVDHSTKSNDNPLHPSGSKRKRAAIGGASYLVTATSPLSASSGGRLSLTAAKDRHGTFARGELAGTFVMTVENSTRCELYEPNPTEKDRPGNLSAILAARNAVEIMRESAEPKSLRALRASMTIRASNTVKDEGIELAADIGSLAESPGPRNARQFSYRQDLPTELAA